MTSILEVNELNSKEFTPLKPLNRNLFTEKFKDIPIAPTYLTQPPTSFHHHRHTSSQPELPPQRVTFIQSTTAMSNT